MVRFKRNRYVLGCALNVPAFFVANPADFGKIDTAVPLIQLESLWIAERVITPPSFEFWKTNCFALSKSFDGLVQILHPLLQNLGVYISKKGENFCFFLRFFLSLPDHQLVAQGVIPQKFGSLVKGCLLFFKGKIPDQTATSGELPKEICRKRFSVFLSGRRRKVKPLWIIFMQISLLCEIYQRIEMVQHHESSSMPICSLLATNTGERLARSF